MATNKARKTAASAKKGDYKPSSIGAKARAAAAKLKSAATGKHSGPETDKPGGAPGKHAKYTGGKHAKSDYTAAKKNAAGDLHAASTGKHSREAAMNNKIAASKPPKTLKAQRQGIGSAEEAVSARKKVRGK